jgi:hypothetical protein
LERLKVRLVSRTFLAFAILSLCAVPAAAQAVWDLTPYEIDIIFAAKPSLDFAWPVQGNNQAEQSTPADDAHASSASAFETALKEEILVRTTRSAAGFWDLRITSPSPRLRRRLLADLHGISLQLLSEESKRSLERDKVMLLVVLPTTDGYEVVARELDVRTRIFGSPVRVRAWHLAKVADAAVLAVRKAFAPLAQILPLEGKEAVQIRLRAGGIPPQDETLRPAAKGQLFRAVIRRNDRDGKLRGVFIVPWTFLMVEDLTGSLAECKLHTGLRSPLSGRRRGRIENLALAVIPPGGSTELVIRARTEPYQPLAGYDVFSQSLDGESSELLGRTNSEGRLRIPESEPPLRRLVVKHGGELMALLPMVPGLVWEPMLGFGRYQGQWPSTLPQAYLLGLLESGEVDESLRAAIESLVEDQDETRVETPSADKGSEVPKLTSGTYDGRAITEVPTPYLVGLLEEAAGMDAQSRTAIQYMVTGDQGAGGPDLARAVLEARVPDDDPRLEAEGYLIGLQGELVDVTIRREILLSRALARMEEKKYDEARQLYEELKGLKSRYDFQRALEQERKKIATNDPILDRKIDRMFEETGKVLRNYLDDRPLDELGRQLLRAPSSGS